MKQRIASNMASILVDSTQKGGRAVKCRSHQNGYHNVTN